MNIDSFTLCKQSSSHSPYHLHCHHTASTSDWQDSYVSLLTGTHTRLMIKRIKKRIITDVAYVRSQQKYSKLLSIKMRRCKFFEWHQFKFAGHLISLKALWIQCTALLGWTQKYYATLTVNTEEYTFNMYA